MIAHGYSCPYGSTLFPRFSTAFTTSKNVKRGLASLLTVGSQYQLKD
ncbi:hypothetical protein LEMLEM_LOCUS1761 [Lemmus lemmus]